jgi:hypothetical protein
MKVPRVFAEQTALAFRLLIYAAIDDILTLYLWCAIRINLLSMANDREAPG